MPMRLAIVGVHRAPLDADQIQLPVSHTALSRAMGHAAPHAPQLPRSLTRSRHAPSHTLCPDGHDVTHAPAEHACPDGHCAPQPPQLLRSA